MKALVATRRTQGQQANDFSHTVDGELVYLGLICGRDRLNPDAGCGCGRAFIGLNSHKATTTAEVREVDLSEDDYLETVRSSLEQAGWNASGAGVLADEMADLAGQWPTGTVVQRRLDEVTPRSH